MSYYNFPEKGTSRHFQFSFILKLPGIGSYYALLSEEQPGIKDYSSCYRSLNLPFGKLFSDNFH